MCQKQQYNLIICYSLIENNLMILIQHISSQYWLIRYDIFFLGKCC